MPDKYRQKYSKDDYSHYREWATSYFNKKKNMHRKSKEWNFADSEELGSYYAEYHGESCFGYFSELTPLRKEIYKKLRHIDYGVVYIYYNGDNPSKSLKDGRVAVVQKIEGHILYRPYIWMKYSRYYLNADGTLGKRF